VCDATETSHATLIYNVCNETVCEKKTYKYKKRDYAACSWHNNTIWVFNGDGDVLPAFYTSRVWRALLRPGSEGTLQRCTVSTGLHMIVTDTSESLSMG